MDKLKIERVAVFGISAGGPSALQFAIRHPERCSALILMVPLAYKPPEAASTVPEISPVTESILMTIVGSDFGCWLSTKLATRMVYRTVRGPPPELVAAASPEQKRKLQLFMDGILPISERVQGIVANSVVSATLTRPDYEKVKVPTRSTSLKARRSRSKAGADRLP